MTLCDVSVLLTYRGISRENQKIKLKETVVNTSPHFYAIYLPNKNQEKTSILERQGDLPISSTLAFLSPVHSNKEADTKLELICYTVCRVVIFLLNLTLNNKCFICYVIVP